MKKISKIAFALSLSFASVASANAEIIYRFKWDDMYFETNNLEEGKRATGREPVARWISVAPNEVQSSFQFGSAYSVPVYRCLVRGTAHHFSSRFPNCEGHVQEGVYGHVFQFSGPGLTPLYRAYADEYASHATVTRCQIGDLGTVDYSNPIGPLPSVNNPYRLEGILGYVRQSDNNCQFSG